MAISHREDRHRLTLYIAQPERRELLEWAKTITHAMSEAEAIFSALQLLKQQMQQKQKIEDQRVLAETKGVWADDPRIAEVFDEIEQGWKRWKIDEF